MRIVERASRQAVVAVLALLVACSATGCQSLLGLKNLTGIGFVEGFFQPFVGGTSTLRGRDPWDIANGHESALRRLTVGCLKNPHRSAWKRELEIGGTQADEEREDENELLAEYLRGLDMFAEVRVVNSAAADGCDFVISLSVECVQADRIDGWAYAFNIFPYCGFGFLLGFPYRQCSAMYVGQAVVFDVRGGRAEPVSGAMASNFREWPAVNLYYTPNYFSGWNLEPIFEQIAGEFLLRSGCLAPAEEAK